VRGAGVAVRVESGVVSKERNRVSPEAWIDPRLACGSVILPRHEPPGPDKLRTECRHDIGWRPEIGNPGASATKDLCRSFLAVGDGQLVRDLKVLTELVVAGRLADLSYSRLELVPIDVECKGVEEQVLRQ
jgi:hypothetical protein